MNLKNLEVRELSLEEKIEIDGGMIIPISWIVEAAVAVGEFVEGFKAGFKAGSREM